MNFSKTKTVTIFVIIISVIYSACCAVSEQRDDLGERYVYPYTPHYGWNGEEVVPDGAKFDFSAVSYYKFSAEKLPVYEDIYSLYEKTENGMTGEYLNTAIDEEYKALCKRNAETYLSLCEPGAEAVQTIHPGSEYEYYVQTDETSVSVIGDKLTVHFKLDCNKENVIEKIFADVHFKSALQMLGFTEYVYTYNVYTGKHYPSEKQYLGVEAAVYPKDGKNERFDFPCRLFIGKYWLDNTFTISIDCSDYKSKTVGDYNVIPYDKALGKLRANQYYSQWGYDLSGVQENEVICVFEYTDKVMQNMVVPCYKFYCPVSNGALRPFYVPAVEFDPENPGTGDAGVYTVAAVSLLSLFAAQYVYKKSKRA